jgi:hypothetical protein
VEVILELGEYLVQVMEQQVLQEAEWAVFLVVVVIPVFPVEVMLVYLEVEMKAVKVESVFEEAM